MPKVTVFSTGDELIGLDGSIIDEGVHDSNSSMIVAQVREAGAQATLASQLPDDAASIANAIRAMSAKRSHIIISTGGVSVGERDYVPAALEACGATIHFHGVYMRPGKPVLFASLPDGTLFFGLPGNPVAAYLGFRFFAYAALRSMVGLAPEVGLEIDVEAPRHAEVTRFLRVRSTFSSCGPRVELLSEQQSHRMRPLLAANAWLAMPPQRDLSRKPIIYPLSCLGVR
nr:molybdopterin-binding protein [Sphingobium lactosutens]